MLVLSRKPGESIVVDDNIIIKVLEIRGGRVRLGFQAPTEVEIRREELVPQEEVDPPPLVTR